MNIFDYVDKYGKYSFSEKEFNDVDNLVFCSLSYLNFSTTSVNNGNHTLEYLGREYISLNNFAGVKRLGIPQKNGYLLIQKLINTKRYKNVVLHDYVYNTNRNKQFSAMMFKINRNLEYICFEGTDELVSGWKEDFELSYRFPIPSHEDAIEYANKHIKVNGPNIIIGGHSKGGNLALVSAMYTKVFKQFRIKKVYSNDGPGLRLKEFNSSEYKRIKKKLIHIVPHNSMIGIILYNDVYNVVKSTRKALMSHAIASWSIEDDHLVESKLSPKSIELEQNILDWVNTHNEKEKEQTVRALFRVLEDSDINKFIELKSFTKIRKVINNIKNIDDHSKKVFFDLIINIFDIDFIMKKNKKGINK